MVARATRSDSPLGGPARREEPFASDAFAYGCTGWSHRAIASTSASSDVVR